MNFYSQQGEDFLAYQILKNKKDGFFVEIGCIDGMCFSNTLAFEQQGWQGICVEAHNDYIDLLKRNRPKSQIVHCAVGPENNQEVTFYANSRGALSTLDKGLENDFKERYGKYFTGFEQQTVPMRTLDSIFDELKVDSIDLLSLDIEGSEVGAIKGMDLNRYQPQLMIIEADTEEIERKLDALILPHHYYKLLKIANNVFYTLDASVYEMFRNKKFSCELIHTEQLLDEGGDEVSKKTLDFNRKTILKKVFQRNTAYCKLLN